MQRESIENNIYSQIAIKNLRITFISPTYSLFIVPWKHRSSSEQRNHILKTKKIISSSILKEDFASSCN
jgi:hypothetical protein